jgi:hypothetical protein
MTCSSSGGFCTTCGRLRASFVDGVGIVSEASTWRVDYAYSANSSADYDNPNVPYGSK